MKNIFHYKDSSDWEYNVKQNVSPGWFKANKTLGLALNVAAPAALLFIFKVDLMTFMLAFIGFDVCMVGMDYLSIGTYKGTHKLAWLTQKAAYEKKVEGLTLDEVKQLREDLRAHGAFYDEKLSLLDNRIEEYRRLDTIATPERHRDTIKYVQEMIEKMRAYSDNKIPFDGCDECIKWIQNKVAKIVDKSDRLIEMIHNNPETIMTVVNTYNIYAEELMNIILKYQEADKEQQDVMGPRLENLLDSFYNKLDRLFNKINDSQRMSLGMDIDYLTKRLNEDIKEDEVSIPAEVIDSMVEDEEES